MNHDLSLAEMKESALPGDWLQDFNFVGGYQLHCCAGCLHPFHSLPFRELCFLCKGGAT